MWCSFAAAQQEKALFSVDAVGVTDFPFSDPSATAEMSGGQRHPEWKPPANAAPVVMTPLNFVDPCQVEDGGAGIGGGQQAEADAEDEIVPTQEVESSLYMIGGKTYRTRTSVLVNPIWSLDDIQEYAK